MIPNRSRAMSLRKSSSSVTLRGRSEGGSSGARRFVAITRSQQGFPPKRQSVPSPGFSPTMQPGGTSMTRAVEAPVTRNPIPGLMRCAQTTRESGTLHELQRPGVVESAPSAPTCARQVHSRGSRRCQTHSFWSPRSVLASSISCLQNRIRDSRPTCVCRRRRPGGPTLPGEVRVRAERARAQRHLPLAPGEEWQPGHVPEGGRRSRSRSGNDEPIALRRRWSR